MREKDAKRVSLAIIHAAAKIVVEEGVSLAQAKRKALLRLKLAEDTALPKDELVEEEVRLITYLYADEEGAAHLRFLREVACKVMRQLHTFSPYLAGSVLEGTAGKYAEIDIQLYPDSGKDVEIFLLNAAIEYEHSVPRSERAEAVLTFDYEEATVNLVIYPKEDERVVFKTRDGKTRPKARLAQVEKLLLENGDSN